jgi:hypothetical protein
MIKLELTEQEALSLRNLLDTAVRAEGMRAAMFALIIDNKILEAAKVNEAEKQRVPGNGSGAVASQVTP